MSVYKYISRYKYIDKTLPIPDLRRKNYLSQQFFSSHTGSLTYLPHTIRASRSINEDQILRQLFFHRSNGHEYNLARVHYFSSYITPRKLPAIGGRGGGVGRLASITTKPHGTRADSIHDPFLRPLIPSRLK